MTTIDPHLQRLYDATPARRRRSVRASVLLEWEGDPDVLRKFGFRVGTVIGNFVTAEMPLVLLPRLNELGIRSIEFGHRSTPMLDKSRVDIGADKIPPITGPNPGEGVIVGIVDTGIDYTHPSFQRAAADGRMLYIWDHRFQLEKPRKHFSRRFPEEALPRGFAEQFQYGVEYEQKGINEAIAAGIVAQSKGKRPRRLRCQDTPRAHGTHVAGIACGSGAPPATVGDPLIYTGIAPNADLIVVALDFARGAKTDKVVEAVDYVRQRAKKLKRPCVINLSLGQSLGARDGSSKYEQMLDAIATDPPSSTNPARAIVIAAGNDAAKAMHASAKVSQGATVSFTLNVEVNDPADGFEIEIWYGLRHPDERMAIEVQSPKGKSTGSIGAGKSAKPVIVENGNVVTVYSAVKTQNDANCITFFINRAKRKKASQISPGQWAINLTGTTIGHAGDSGEFHAYLARPNRDRTKASDPKFAVFAGAVKQTSTLTIPGTAKEAICVVSYITKPIAENGNLSAFSSRGPTLDAQARSPTIAAPGELIRSTRAYNAKSGSGFFLDMQGTSMAAPHVTGVVAAMLQVNPELTQKEIVKILQDTARKVGGNPVNEWGRGKLDAEEAVKVAAASAANV